MRNLQEQVKKAFCYQKLFWPFTVWINCCSDLKNFANSRPSASNFKSFSRSLEQIFSHSRSEQFWKQNTSVLLQCQKSPRQARVVVMFPLYNLRKKRGGNHSFSFNKDSSSSLLSWQNLLGLWIFHSRF